eukprot:gene6582-2185_t
MTIPRSLPEAELKRLLCTHNLFIYAVGQVLSGCEAVGARARWGPIPRCVADAIVDL